MPAAISKEAVQLAARRSARQASKVLEAVVGGPEAPAPAGWGVELRAVQQSLPLFRANEIVAFASHLGQRREVVSELAAELAQEAGQRMGPRAGCREDGDGEVARSEGHRLTATAHQAAGAARMLSGREVASVVFSFSKILPQLPEYACVYQAVAQGVMAGAWTLSRLQAGLVGTALVDTGHHLNDALPTLLRPWLAEVVAEGGEGPSEMVVDELRYLVHACHGLPESSRLRPEELEALASCTRRLAGSANFAKGAHLLVAWLQLEVPQTAKRAHLEALRVCCDQLHGLEPHYPAHPMPQGGLAPSLGRLLARDQECPHGPPLTPPLLRSLTHALVQISRGARWESVRRSRSLCFDDWAEISRQVVGFCDAHQAEMAANDDPRAERSGSCGRPLPGWAAHTLGHMFAEVYLQPSPGGAPPELDAMLQALRLLHHYRPYPAPRRQFFTWAASQVASHHRAARTDGAPAPPGLAEVVGELVPRLPEAERARLAALLLEARPRGRSSAAVASPLAVPPASTEAAATDASSRPRLLAGAGQAADARPGMVLAGAPSHSVQAAQHLAPPVAEVGARVGVSGGLWGLLSRSGPGAGAGPRERAVQAASPATASQPLRAGPAESTAREAVQTPLAEPDPSPQAAQLAGPAEAPAPQALREAVLSAATQAPEVSQEGVLAATATAPEATSDVALGELTDSLARALARVEALEARLEEHERRRAAAAAVAEERASSAEPRAESPAASAAAAAAASPLMASGQGSRRWRVADTTLADEINTQAAALRGWVPGALLQDPPPMGMQQMATSSTSRRRTFSFDEYRQSHSAKLQSERLRVLVPPDYYPILPMAPRHQR